MAGSDMASLLTTACDRGRPEPWGWHRNYEGTQRAIAVLLDAADIPMENQLSAMDAISEAVRCRRSADEHAAKLDALVGEDGWQRIAETARETAA